MDYERRIASLESELADALPRSDHLQRASQAFVEHFFEAFRDLTVLCRVFVTLQVKDLPEADRSVLSQTASDQELPFTDDDYVLTLLGTQGIDPSWNDRTTSRGHRVIPLLSQALIDEAPMISRLMSELGFANLDTRSDWQYLTRAADGAGLFFVGDARTATDARGRAIIPASDFVRRFSVKTVFGFGDVIRDRKSLLAVVVFCNRAISRDDALAFQRLGDVLVALTDGALANDRLFRD